MNKILLFALVLALAWWLRQWVRLKRRPLGLFLRLKGRLEEYVPWPLSVASGPDLRRIRTALLRAASDSQVRLLFVDLDDLAIGWAKAQELRKLLTDFSSSGKPVVAYLNNADEKVYYVASAANEIYASPTSFLEITGLSVETAHLKGVFDKLGVEAQIETEGKYKGADEMFTRTSMSEELRESMTALLEEIFQEFVRAGAISRGKTEQAFRALVDRGPFSASGAMEEGLIDGSLYKDEVTDAQEELLGGPLLWIPAEQFGRWKRCLQRLLPGRPKLAILYADGVIHSGSGAFASESTGISPDSFSRVVRSVMKDRRYKGMLVRINTPGGTVTASDALRYELIRAKSRFPVVISMSDVSASGGYYLCTAADRVLAYPCTLTGSIGVVWGKFSVQGLLNRIGIGTDRLSLGKRAGMNSPFKPYTEEEQQVLSKHMKSVYDDFVDKVARGRGLSREAAERAAEGRAWTGLAAKELGLVDELGGIEEALQCLARLSGGTTPSDFKQVHISLKSFWSGLPFWARPISSVFGSFRHFR